MLAIYWQNNSDAFGIVYFSYLNVGVQIRSLRINQCRFNKKRQPFTKRKFEITYVLFKLSVTYFKKLYLVFVAPSRVFKVISLLNYFISFSCFLVSFLDTFITSFVFFLNTTVEAPYVLMDEFMTVTLFIVSYLVAANTLGKGKYYCFSFLTDIKRKIIMILRILHYIDDQVFRREINKNMIFKLHYRILKYNSENITFFK